MKHLALFSQTGSEICNLYDLGCIKPNMIVSDNVRTSNPLDKRMYNLNVYFRNYGKLNHKQKIEYYKEIFGDHDLITLHGWLHIIPPEICEQYSIYNGHPALINLYPELKGKDPQERTWANIDKYEYIGSVVHKVTAEVDGGEIVDSVKVKSSRVKSLENIYEELKITSLDSWVSFFNNKKYVN